jgi:hypothetical protein
MFIENRDRKPVGAALRATLADGKLPYGLFLPERARNIDPF